METFDFSYDTVDQLVDVDYSGTGVPADETFTYDDSGNRTDTGYPAGDHNRLHFDGTYVYHYDHNGNRMLRFVRIKGVRYLFRSPPGLDG